MTNYSDFVKAVAADSGMSIVATKKVMASITKELTKELSAADGKVRIPDLGTFSVSAKNERTYKSKLCPNGVTVPAHYSARFSPAKALKESVLTIKVSK